MNIEPLPPRIVSAERLNGGLLIAFDDGKIAIYSATLLHDALPQAQEFNEADLED